MLTFYTMKKALLFLLFANLSFSQDAIEIRLVNQNVGSVDEYSTFPVYSQSTDPNMNIILQNHNVSNYEYKLGHPVASLNGRIIQIIGDPLYYNSLMNALLAYNTVVESVQYTTAYGGFSDAAYSKLVNISVGTPTGVNSNNIITTNDNGLNQIFINHNVIHYQQISTSSSNPEILKTYVLACNCDASQLRSDLDAYNTIIEYTETLPAGYLLNSTNFNTKDIKIYPNPFEDTITIDTNLSIKNFSVIDLIGKKIIDTESNEILNSEVAKLNSGTYILQLQSVEGIIHNEKIIKN